MSRLLSTTVTVTVTVAIAVAVTVAACAPTQREIRAAREAEYPGQRAEVLRLAAAAVAKSEPVTQVDDESGTIMTATRWYGPDGATIGDDRIANAGTLMRQANQVSLAFRVIVIGDAAPFHVIVEPVARQTRAGYSAPYPYLPDDPAMPGWIHGKVDDLQLAVHHRLARWTAAPDSVARE